MDSGDNRDGRLCQAHSGATQPGYAAPLSVITQVDRPRKHQQPHELGDQYGTRDERYEGRLSGVIETDRAGN